MSKAKSTKKRKLNLPADLVWTDKHGLGRLILPVCRREGRMVWVFWSFDYVRIAFVDKFRNEQR